MYKQTYRVCFCFSRRFGLSSGITVAPQEIKDLFHCYSENNGTIMTVDHLHRFLIEIQGEVEATRDDAESIIDALSDVRHLIRLHKKGLHFEAFFKYLFSDKNMPLSPKLGVHHGMNAPLSHYFVYTGHNSYLTGNQLSSNSSDVPIINALKRGVRVIELDMWPNSSNDNINVLHGRTLTAPVELIKCLRSIKDHAFTASNSPLILTLEDHLKPNLQSKVASMLTEIFGDVLYTPGSEILQEFPSAESVKGRIIISTKPPKEYLEAQEIKENETNQTKAEDLTDAEASGKEVLELKGSHADLSKDVLDEDNDKKKGLDDGGEAHQNVPLEYKQLIAIPAGKPKGSLDDFLKVDPDKVRRLSLSELELEKAVITHGKEIVRFTQRNLLRVYPSGIRVDSSNFDPFTGWMHGAQMVAFNMQGMFRANGGCGYIKKPDFLLHSGPQDEILDPKAELPVKMTLKVTVYMGEGWYHDFRHTDFDPYSPPDFYVRVGIAGVPADSLMKKTKTIEDNWTPAWNEQFEFPLTVPELALLRVEVLEYDASEINDFGGQTCLPVAELRRGIRAVPLHDKEGEKYRSVKLLMRFEYT